MSEAQEELNYLLSRIPLFKAFSTAAALDLTERVTERKAPEGQRIFNEGEPGTELLIVRRGCVKIFLEGARESDEAVLAVLKEGEFFGELSLLDGETRSASAVAMTDTILLCLSHDDFYGALQSDFQAVKHVIAVLCHRLRATDVRLAAAAFRDIRERLANCLWRIAEEQRTIGAEAASPCVFSDADLAERVGATVERVHVELGRLQRDLVIRREGHNITILKPHDLRDMARGESSASVITVPEWLLG